MSLLHGISLWVRWLFWELVCKYLLRAPALSQWRPELMKTGAKCENYGQQVNTATTHRAGIREIESSWNVMAHGEVREGKWRGNWRMEWVVSTLHTTSKHDVSSITTADAHTSAASSRLNWRPRRFKWTRPFRRKTKSGFCACAITFQTQSTSFESCKRTNYPDKDDTGCHQFLRAIAKTKQINQPIILLTFVLKVCGSDPSQDIEYTDYGFSWFSSCFPRKLGDNTSNQSTVVSIKILSN